MNEGTGTEEYYHRWAPDYDEVYTRPERQADMLAVRARLTEWFAGKHVLEVAAGTGWWTTVLADTAASVTATDVNRAAFDVARARRGWPPSVDFAVADALQLDTIRGDFDAAFAGFFWSHLPLARIDASLEGLMQRLLPGSLMVFIDNRLVPGSVHPVNGAPGRTGQHLPATPAEGRKLMGCPQELSAPGRGAQSAAPCAIG